MSTKYDRDFEDTLAQQAGMVRPCMAYVGTASERSALF